MFSSIKVAPIIFVLSIIALSGCSQKKSIEISVDSTINGARISIAGFKDEYSFTKGLSERNVEFDVPSAGIRSETWGLGSKYHLFSDKSLLLDSDSQSIEIFQNFQDREIDRQYPIARELDKNIFVLNMDYFSIGDAPIIVKPRPDSGVSIVSDNCSTPDFFSFESPGERLGKYVAFSKRDTLNCTYSDRATFLASSAIPLWMLEDIQRVFDSAVGEAESLWGRHKGNKPLVIIGSKLSAKKTTLFRGEVGAKNAMFLRFYGNGWSNKTKENVNELNGFVRHETMHLWFRERLKPKSPQSDDWFYEGMAEYMSYIIKNNQKQNIDELIENIDLCRKGFEDVTNPSARSGATYYNCPSMYFWVFDLFSQKHLKKTLPMIVSDLLKDPHHCLESNPSDCLTSKLEEHEASFNLLTSMLTDIVARKRGSVTGEDWDIFARSLSPLGVKLEFNRQYSNFELVFSLLFGVLRSNCNGDRIGYNIEEDGGYRLDTGARCKQLSGDPVVEKINGVNIKKVSYSDYQTIINTCQKSDSNKLRLSNVREGVVYELSCPSKFPVLRSKSQLSIENPL